MIKGDDGVPNRGSEEEAVVLHISQMQIVAKLNNV